mmetsp:Transcript_7366/g.19337  ORF Transcript_7366/g.19337 Transcript_7366/m.19337 type:complete len:218 (+) Transcript_7366:1059-1712(+)
MRTEAAYFPSMGATKSLPRHIGRFAIHVSCITRLEVSGALCMESVSSESVSSASGTELMTIASAWESSCMAALPPATPSALQATSASPASPLSAPATASASASVHAETKLSDVPRGMLSQVRRRCDDFAQLRDENRDFKLLAELVGVPSLVHHPFLDLLLPADPEPDSCDFDVSVLERIASFMALSCVPEDVFSFCSKPISAPLGPPLEALFEPLSE